MKEYFVEVFVSDAGGWMYQVKAESNFRAIEAAMNKLDEKEKENLLSLEIYHIRPVEESR